MPWTCWFPIPHPLPLGWDRQTDQTDHEFPILVTHACSDVYLFITVDPWTTYWFTCTDLLPVPGTFITLLTLFTPGTGRPWDPRFVVVPDPTTHSLPHTLPATPPLVPGQGGQGVWVITPTPLCHPHPHLPFTPPPVIVISG